MDLHHTQILKSLGYSDPYPRYSELRERLHRFENGWLHIQLQWKLL